MMANKGVPWAKRYAAHSHGQKVSGLPTYSKRKKT
jgi:hypothetical protein